jgi:hypothetical protein
MSAYDDLEAMAAQELTELREYSKGLENAALVMTEDLEELRELNANLSRDMRKLRELNADLLQALIETLPYAKNWIGEDSSIKWAESIVAKAEKLK